MGLIKVLTICFNPSKIQSKGYHLPVKSSKVADNEETKENHSTFILLETKCCKSTLTPFTINTFLTHTKCYSIEQHYFVIFFLKSRVVRKPASCICENKDADQLHGNREADQRLCFRYIECTIPLLLQSEISSF